MIDDTNKHDAAWLDWLDAIIAGDDTPAPEDDEMLHVAVRLAQALAPLSTLDADAEARRQHQGTRLRARLAASPPQRWSHRSRLLAVAATLLLALGLGILGVISPQASAASWKSVVRSEMEAPQSTIN
jgi:hypothetical protein